MIKAQGRKHRSLWMWVVFSARIEYGIMIVREEVYTEVVAPGASRSSAAHIARDGDLESPDSFALDDALSSGLDGLVANAISQVASPPIVAATAMAITASTLPGPSAWMWAGTYVSLAILIPLLYLVCLVQQGIVTDLDVQLREQRMRPLIFTMVCNGLAWGVLVLGAAPAQLVLLAGALWVQTVLIFVITLRWKISVHCAAAASLGTLVWSLIGTPWPLLIGVPIVAWSRVLLRRHTLAQTVAGALLGIAIFAAALWLVRVQ